MSSFVAFNANLVQLEAIGNEFAALPQQLLRAAQRALRKAANSAMSRAAGPIASHNGLPVRAVRKRMSAMRNQSNPMAYSLWFGTMPIAAINLGSPRQTRKGVRVGKQLFSGAFVTALGGNQQIVRRSAQSAMASGRDKNGRVRRGRLPIEVMRAEIDYDHATDVLTREAENGMRRELPRLLRAELNYELNVKGLAA